MTAIARQTRLLVISDLHLGGRAAHDGKPAFQICTERGRRRLAAFVAWAAAQRTSDRDVHLVIAGDIVDFLAEERGGGFQAFTAHDGQATEKLAAILDDTADVWRALRAFVEGGGALTLMLGNHDVELSLPGPRRLLVQTIGPGRVDFIYDNQAFTLGRVLVEHGNRYDDWNAVPHDDLRGVRSRLSRGEPAQLEPLPGSRMVIELVNPVKEKLAFVDLLKPEDAALLPFLALLAPDCFRHVVGTLRNRVRAWRVRYRPGQQPQDANYIAADRKGGAVPAAAGTGDAADDALLELAAEAAAGGIPAMAGSSTRSFLDTWRADLADDYRERLLGLLHRTLRATRGAHERAFAIEHEKEQYLAAATETAARGYDVIVYGHTHLPKRVSLDGRRNAAGFVVGPGAIYLNSGTWADVMAVPRGVLAEPGAAGADAADAGAARRRLAGFAGDLAAGRLDPWRRQLPTFVRVDVDGQGRVKEAALETLNGDPGTPAAVTTASVCAVLEGEGPS